MMQGRGLPAHVEHPERNHHPDRGVYEGLAGNPGKRSFDAPQRCSQAMRFVASVSLWKTWRALDM